MLGTVLAELILDDGEIKLVSMPGDDRPSSSTSCEPCHEGVEVCPIARLFFPEREIVTRLSITLKDAD
jgi:predicted molibdopterin-dependent oxidoreductase YjgC